MAERKVLLVEGIDDLHVLIHLSKGRGLDSLHEIIEEKGGVEPLLESLPVHLKESDIAALGVLLDADVDLAARWRSIRDRLSQAGYEDVPANPDPAGTILSPPPTTLLPRVGVWLMPNNSTTGMLEDFLQWLVPPGSELFAHAKKSVSSIPEAERRFTEGHEPKALIHTWLAWQEEPGKPFGTAITAKFLNAGSPEADPLIAWLRRLFFDDHA